MPTLRCFILFALPALLLIPVFYYALDTPIALIDDLSDWQFKHALHSPADFASSLEREVRGKRNTRFPLLNDAEGNWEWKEPAPQDYDRFRPAFIYYNALTWTLYGEAMWLHHLTRWLLHYAAVFIWAAAFLSFIPRGGRFAAASLVPLSLLVWLWVFYPNQPAARLAAQETPLVFWLGLCVYATAAIIRRVPDRDGDRDGADAGAGAGAGWRHYALLAGAFLGLGLTKETAVAPMLWVLLFHGALVWRLPASRRKGHWFALLALALVFVAILYRVYAAYALNGYAAPDFAAYGLWRNGLWQIYELFQIGTAPYIAAALSLLSAAALASVIMPVVRRRGADCGGRWLFTVFLLGLAVAMYLILLTSGFQSPRYWHILIPVFTALLALGARYALEAVSPFALRYGVAVLLAGFAAVFIAANYWNFLYQTIAQHSLRHAEAQTIAATSALLCAGEYVVIPKVNNEYSYSMHVYFDYFAPYWRGEHYRIHGKPPDLRDARSYYAVVWTHSTRIHEEPERVFRPRTDYAVLNYAYRAANALQAGKPRRTLDYGVADPETYGWILYRRQARE